ncbi:MAG TPA: hypothetical protein VKT29_09685 [Terriglobales bacterium]|nr:hypothetical protein [Terriglobales bacterium]
MRAVRNGFFAGAVLTLVLALGAWAQSGSDQSWDSSTNLQDQTGAVNPTRIQQSHKEEDGKTVDVQTLETKGINGENQVYGQTETETVKVDANTTRTTTRHYVTNSDGEKIINSVTVEEKHELSDGGEHVVRTVSSPDANGGMQVTQREIQETDQTSPDVRTTNATVFLPGADGALAPSTRTHEVEKQVQPGVTEYTKSVSLQDGNGNWQINEVRQGTIEKAGETETKKENVSRLNADGRMALAEHTVTTETKNNGEQRKDVQKFSTSIGGTTADPDGQMHLDSQTTTVMRTGPGGEQVKEERVEQRSTAAPDEGLRPSQHVIDITRTDLNGAQQQRQTIESVDPNGGMGVVWVDTRKTTGNGPVVVDTKKPAAKPANPPAH